MVSKNRQFPYFRAIIFPNKYLHNYSHSRNFHDLFSVKWTVNEKFNTFPFIFSNIKYFWQSKIRVNCILFQRFHIDSRIFRVLFLLLEKFPFREKTHKMYRLIIIFRIINLLCYVQRSDISSRGSLDDILSSNVCGNRKICFDGFSKRIFRMIYWFFNLFCSWRCLISCDLWNFHFQVFLVIQF